MDLVRSSNGVDPSARRTWPASGWSAPRAAYVHVPFCRHRCGYCNFSVVANRDDLIDQFIQAIDDELAPLDRPQVDSIFIGGGTPTHLNPDQLGRFLQVIRNRFELASGAEFSSEANPEDIDQATVELLVHNGINRLSMGVQSFQSQKLAVLERGHSGDSAQQAIERAVSLIPNLSIDLIFGAPEETIQQWNQDLETAVSLPITHVSTYALTFEKGTSFWSRRMRGNLNQLDEGIELAMYHAAIDRLTASGFQHYEISNFAQPENRCRHNLAYWEGRGWWAAGPGAARFVDGTRSVNHRSTTEYLKRMNAGDSPVQETDRLTVDQYARERFAFGMRMLDGVDVDLLTKETGIDLRQLCDAELDTLRKDGLIQLNSNQRTGNRVCLTPLGLRFADTVCGRLLG